MKKFHRSMQNMEQKMTGNPPQDHLQRMFNALRIYARPLKRCYYHLQKAYDAVEEDDIDSFKRSRARIIRIATARTGNVLSHLLNRNPTS
jgi:hypothetical protein